jgi:hypothetical protein
MYLTTLGTKPLKASASNSMHVHATASASAIIDVVSPEEDDQNEEGNQNEE